MDRSEIIFAGVSHQKDFPVFEKKLVYDDATGDQHEEFVRVSPDELSKRRSMTLFGDIVNGTEVSDTSHFDKFQLMDVLERMIDDIPDEKIAEMLGKSVEL